MRKARLKELLQGVDADNSMLRVENEELRKELSEETWKLNHYARMLDEIEVVKTLLEKQSEKKKGMLEHPEWIGNNWPSPSLITLKA